MPSTSEFNMYFDGTQGWFGPDGPKSLDVSKLIEVDKRPLMKALRSRFGVGVFNRVIFIDWAGGVSTGPYAGRRFGGYYIPAGEGQMWTNCHDAALRRGKPTDYSRIHRQGYPKVTLEVSRNAEDKWKWGTVYDPIDDPARAKLWLQRD